MTDDCLTTASWLIPVKFLMTARQVPNNFPWWLSDERWLADNCWTIVFLKKVELSDNNDRQNKDYNLQVERLTAVV